MKMNPNLVPPFIEMPDGKLVYRTELVIAQERIAELERTNTIQAARIAELEADLHECLEYFKANYDVVDGDYGEPAPNKEMRLGTMIETTLYDGHGPENFR